MVLIRRSIWADPEWTRLTSSAQLVALFCMAARQTGPCSAARIVRRTGWDRTVVEGSLTELADSAYAHFTESAKAKRRKMPQKTSSAVFERDRYACVHCGTNERLTVDHIWPVSKGGDDDLDNLQTLCHSCNSKKGARTHGVVQSR